MIDAYATDVLKASKDNKTLIAIYSNNIRV